jgi:hypothetical protein
MKEGVTSDGLSVDFSPAEELVNLNFSFLGYIFTEPVTLDQARRLYKNLSSSSSWMQSAANSRRLVAIGSERFEACQRCEGRGDIPRFRHVQEGICFLCWGSGGQWGTENSSGAIRDFSFACKDQELGDLYSRLQKGMQRSARKKANAPAEAEMERIRERRRVRALEKKGQ